MTAEQAAVLLAKISAVTQVTAWCGGIVAYVGITSDAGWAWVLAWVMVLLLGVGLVAAAGMGVAMLMAKKGKR